MRRHEVFIWCVLTVFGRGGPVSAQALAENAKAPRKALLISNTNYAKLPPRATDDSTVNGLVDALRGAQFQVTVARDLNLAALSALIDKFQSDIHADDVSLVYFIGYSIQDLNQDQDTHLVPIEFDPASKAAFYDSTVSLVSRVQEGIARRNPRLSMFFLDVSGNRPRSSSGQFGIAQPAVPRHAWMFASEGPGQMASGSPPPEGLFTRALTRSLSQPGIDLNHLDEVVSRDVETASMGVQHPQAWSSDVPVFQFLEPVGGEKINGNDRSTYVYIPAGRFWMGCAPKSDDQCERNEKPRHQVEITKGFWLGQTEVTDTAFRRYARATGKSWKPPKSNTNAGKEGDLPVVSVSWEDGQKYCGWVAKGGRLPTEAEWERAARDGRDDEVFPFSDLSASRLKANFMGKAGNDIFDELAPVKQFDPSANYKLYDMAGNVWEWVSDWYSETYYEQSSHETTVRDPQGPSQAERVRKHVARGGSYASDPKKHLRISYRFAAETANNVGFRCLLPDTPEVRGTWRN